MAGGQTHSFITLSLLM